MGRIFLIFLFVAGLLAVSVYRAKEGAQQSEANIKKLEQQIAAEKESLRVLKAEEAHLMSPKYIGPIAREKLGMGPMRPRTICWPSSAA